MFLPVPWLKSAAGPYHPRLVIDTRKHSSQVYKRLGGGNKTGGGGEDVTGSFTAVLHCLNINLATYLEKKSEPVSSDLKGREERSR